MLVNKLKYELKQTFKFFNYPTEVIVSKARRPIYYQQKDIKTLPKMYLKELGNKYDWHDGKLFDKSNDEFVIKNKRTVGKPKYKKINGQNLHDLTLRDYDRSKIIDEIKHFFYEGLKKYNIEAIKESLDSNKPIIIEMIFVTDAVSIGDLDNHAIFYQKTFFDCIQLKKHVRNTKTKKIELVDNKLGFIEDDGVNNIADFVVSFKQINNTIKNLVNGIMIQIYQERDTPLLIDIPVIIEKATLLAQHDCDDVGLSNENSYFIERYDYYFEMLTN